MTRLERIKSELDRLIAYRSEAMKQNNLFLLESIQEKIRNKEKELQQAKDYAPMRLLDFLNDKGEEGKEQKCRKGKSISRTAQYKLAGNSIVTACLENIFEQLFYPDTKQTIVKQLSLF